MAGASRRTARAVVGTVTITVALALGGCGGGDGDGGDGGEASPTPEPTETVTDSPSPSPSASPSPTGTGTARVTLRPDDALGNILAGPDGRTLYLFASDTEESTCYEACAEAWPPLTVPGEPEAGEGVRPYLLGTTKRNDGSRQVTYGGHPVYYYADDEEPGETDGQGLDQFGAQWWVLDEAGNKVGEQAGDGQQQDPREQDGGY